MILKLHGATMRSLLWGALCAFSIGGCVREKDRLDEEVRRLCAKDGGIRVYEQVKMPPQMFDKFGAITFQDSTDLMPLGHDFVLREETKYYRTGRPALRREHAEIIRASDNRVLGEFTSYHRTGGDLPGPWHDSAFACPADIGTASLERSVFVIEPTREQ